MAGLKCKGYCWGDLVASQGVSPDGHVALDLGGCAFYHACMARSGTGASASNDREARLKAALKANMARRKAQARARKEAQETSDTAQKSASKEE